jgi:hypothetical protein
MDYDTVSGEERGLNLDDSPSPRWGERWGEGELMVREKFSDFPTYLSKPA